MTLILKKITTHALTKFDTLKFGHFLKCIPYKKHYM